MPTPSSNSGLRDNHTRGTEADFLKDGIRDRSRLSVVSAVSTYFTIYAYDALKECLDRIDHLDFLFGEPSFVNRLDPSKSVWQNTHRAHIEILFDLSLGELHDKHGFTNFVELQASWQKTLDTSALNKRFYQELANWYFWALPQAQFPRHAPKDAEGCDSLSLIRLITRVIFCWFLKEKGLLPDALFDPRKVPTLLNDVSPKESTYYKAIRQNLFFATLNQEMDNREFRKDGQHFMAHNLYRYRRLLKNAKVRGLIHTLERYKFTVAENTPIEEEIALDPELLGKVFENLLAAYNPETGAIARKQTGSFYTPREIVNYMVDESLLASLKTKLEAACRAQRTMRNASVTSSPITTSRTSSRPPK